MVRSTEGSTESSPLVFGVETALLSTAAKKGDKWYRGVGEAADCFMARWHRDEVEKSWLRTPQRAPRVKTKKRGGGEGRQSYGYCCRRKQKRNVRPCGKVPVRLISGT